MADPVEVYVFRQIGIIPAGETVVSVTRSECVALTFGAGGHWGEAGLVNAFGGAIFFRNDDTGVAFLGVWGRRKASRFRTYLRNGNAVVLVHDAPPARLVWRCG